MRYVSSIERLGFQRGVQQGMQQSEAAVLIRLLRRRFHHLPAHYMILIQGATSESLLLWSERVLDAATLEEIFQE